MSPLKPGNWDMTTQSKMSLHKDKPLTLHILNQLKYSRDAAILIKNKTKTLGPVCAEDPPKKLGGEGGRDVYKDISGIMEEFVGPVWSPPCSKQPFEP